MEITKYEHATMILDLAGRRLVIDPGNFLSLTDFPDVVGVVITHEHPDHWTPQNLGRILRDSPGARILGTPAVVTEAAAAGIIVEPTTAGMTASVDPFELSFFGGQHAVIHSSIPVIDNVGVIVNGDFAYAGDSFALPGVPVTTLAVPAGGPWMKLAEAMDYTLAVAPKNAFTVHEMPLSTWGQDLAASRLDWAAAQGGGVLHRLAPGETLNL